MKRLLLVAAVAAAGCYSTDGDIGATDNPSGVSSFRVEVRKVTGIDGSGNTLPLSVQSSCAARYGSQAAVPEAVKGTPDCLYSIPQTSVEMQLAITALDGKGQPLDTFNGPVSFRVVPGELSGDYRHRWTQMTNGQGTGTVRVARIYGETRVWVQHEPPELDYSGGEVGGIPSELPPANAGPYTYATGLIAPIHFEAPTLASMQVPPDLNNNRLSPFAGQFLTIGRPPEGGAPLTQNCPPGYDPNDASKKDPNDGKLVTMVVTGLDPGGFFVTDLTACRVREPAITGTRPGAPDPTGFLPGTYASIYIYNYSFPEGLYPGDLLWTISGSAQEFAGTTQLSFPAWIFREKVRELPPAQWGKYLSQVPVPELNLRHCGLADTMTNVATNSLCGYYYENLKMESLESALVKLRRVRFPQAFKNCDLNGNNTIPWFCPSDDYDNNNNNRFSPCESSGPENDEALCHINCVVGLGEFSGKLCAERTTYSSFGQFVVEMAGPGPRAAGLDDALEGRMEALTPSSSESRASSVLPQRIASGPSQVRLWCNVPVRVKFGPPGVQATATDYPLAARALLEHPLTGNEQSVAVLAEGATTEADKCYVSLNSRTRISIITRDAVPELQVDCDPEDADTERGRQCKLLREATYNVTGHVKQVTAARPRWMVMPRDADDICCFPGPEAECPRPIQPCPAEDLP